MVDEWWVEWGVSTVGVGEWGVLMRDVECRVDVGSSSWVKGGLRLWGLNVERTRVVLGECHRVRTVVVCVWIVCQDGPGGLGRQSEGV